MKTKVSTRRKKQNQYDVLTRTSPDSPMGQLLRRYWWPVAGVSEFVDKSTKRIRLLGEDLVAFRDLSGHFGVLQRHCPHRGADLADGCVEADGLRCSYHGWQFSPNGSCVEAPFEDTAGNQRFHLTVKAGAYPCQIMGGLLWTYLGPHPQPVLPRFEFFDWPNGFRQIVLSSLPCNWLQCQENSMDPIHFEWRHTNWNIRAAGINDTCAPRHVRLEFEEFEHGFIYRRLRDNSGADDPLWTIGRVCLWPSGLYTGNHAEFRVPIDDLNTLSVTWHFSRVPKEREPYLQPLIPTWVGPTTEENGEWITSHVTNQDFVAWVGQGRIADRSLEHLGASDKGIVLMRRRFLEDLDMIGTGIDPKAVVRSTSNELISLPSIERDLMLNGASLQDLLADPVQRERMKTFVFQAGQPDSVRREYLNAMGIEDIAFDNNRPTIDLLATDSRKSPRT
jgi:5,5'-dehydrodivanillate O-demethylase oxygenase subunit